jgi:hypothetical protein
MPTILAVLGLSVYADMLKSFRIDVLETRRAEDEAVGEDEVEEEVENEAEGEGKGEYKGEPVSTVAPLPDSA